MNPITVISLGPGAGECMTLAALDALRQAPQVILRTARTEAADSLHRQGVAFTSLDALYDAAEDFDALNAALVSAVLAAAEKAPLVYAVLDAQRDQSVHSLLASPDARVQLLPGVGLFDPIAMYHPDARVCPAYDLPEALGDEPLLIIEVDNALLAGEVKLRLLSWFGPDCPCRWYAPDSAVTRHGADLTLEALDRQRRYDHTAALYIAPPPLTAKQRYTAQDLVRIMRILRGEDGCPWDRAQTHESLRPYLIEEAYEVTQAIRDEDWAHVADELGDVLLQVVFQANIGEQYGTLELSDITTAICAKMIRRHPHIFGATHTDTAEQVTQNWEAIKRQERHQHSLGETLRDIPVSLPPLMRAQKAWRKAAAAGACSPSPDLTLRRLLSAVEALKAASPSQDNTFDALGELLLACTAFAGAAQVDCETALSDATERFIRRVTQPDQGTASDVLS